MSGLDAELRNVGPGPDRLAPTAVEADFAVVVCHRDFYCSNCRRQARRLGERYDEFRARDAEVVAVLPDGVGDARDWQSKYDLQYPVLADPDAVVGDALDQPVRFGLLGRLHDVVGRMPAAAVVDLRGSVPTVVYVHRGSYPADRPDADELLSELDRAASNDPSTRPDPDATEVIVEPASGTAGAESGENGGETSENSEDADSDGDGEADDADAGG